MAKAKIVKRERVEPVENPETGAKVYPFWDSEGRPVDRNGYVVR